MVDERYYIHLRVEPSVVPESTFTTPLVRAWTRFSTGARPLTRAPQTIHCRAPPSIPVSQHSIVRFDTTSIPSEQSPTTMDDHNRISSMRVSRKSYQGAGSPFGLWTLPDPLDGPSFAPCYAPYGEQSPPIVSRPSVEQAATVPNIDNDARKVEGLKPWEKGSKTGKKIKTGRGPKGRPRAGEQSNVGSTENADPLVRSGVSTTTTSTLSSSRPSPLSSIVSDPMRDAARRPRFRLLAPAAPVNVYPANTAQAAIAKSRSTSVFLSFLTITNAGWYREKL